MCRPRSYNCPAHNNRRTFRPLLSCAGLRPSHRYARLKAEGTQHNPFRPPMTALRRRSLPPQQQTQGHSFDSPPRLPSQHFRHPRPRRPLSAASGEPTADFPTAPGSGDGGGGGDGGGSSGGSSTTVMNSGPSGADLKQRRSPPPRPPPLANHSARPRPSTNELQHSDRFPRGTSRTRWSNDAVDRGWRQDSSWKAARGGGQSRGGMGSDRDEKLGMLGMAGAECGRNEVRHLSGTTVMYAAAQHAVEDLAAVSS